MALILYVEDHPPAQMLMQAIVGDITGHELLLADSGAVAQALVHANSPDLYILDLDLPDTDGIALAEALHRIHPAPVILVSAYAEAAAERARSDFVSLYLAKPLDPDYVAETIQRTLARPG